MNVIVFPGVGRTRAMQKAKLDASAIRCLVSRMDKADTLHACALRDEVEALMSRYAAEANGIGLRMCLVAMEILEHRT